MSEKISDKFLEHNWYKFSLENIETGRYIYIYIGHTYIYIYIYISTGHTYIYIYACSLRGYHHNGLWQFMHLGT